MIADTILVPSERPHTLDDIKRALLSYSKVYLVDPADRDLIPPNAFPMAIGLPPFLGFSPGPIRPIGKLYGYDEMFGELVEECRPAIQNGLVEVITTYRLEAANGFTIGAVDLGNYPLHPQAILSFYRTLSAVVSDRG